jgi:hypothetical protein
MDARTLAMLRLAAVTNMEGAHDAMGSVSRQPEPDMGIYQDRRNAYDEASDPEGMLADTKGYEQFDDPMEAPPETLPGMNPGAQPMLDKEYEPTDEDMIKMVEKYLAEHPDER